MSRLTNKDTMIVPKMLSFNEDITIMTVFLILR